MARIQCLFLKNNLPSPTLYTLKKRKSRPASTNVNCDWAWSTWEHSDISAKVKNSISTLFHNFGFGSLAFYSLKFFSRNLLWVSIFIYTESLNLFGIFFTVNKRIFVPSLRTYYCFFFWMEQFTRLLVFWNHFISKWWFQSPFLPDKQMLNRNWENLLGK